jgi:hypothetical protein
MAAIAILEFSPYNMNRMRSDPAVILDFVRPFARVAIYEAEEAHPRAELSGAEAAVYLREYEAKCRTVPKGHYLNLIAYR